MLIQNWMGTKMERFDWVPALGSLKRQHSNL